MSLLRTRLPHTYMPRHLVGAAVLSVVPDLVPGRVASTVTLAPCLRCDHHAGRGGGQRFNGSHESARCMSPAALPAGTRRPRDGAAVGQADRRRTCHRTAATAAASARAEPGLRQLQRPQVRRDGPSGRYARGRRGRRRSGLRRNSCRCRIGRPREKERRQPSARRSPSAGVPRRPAGSEQVAAHLLQREVSPARPRVWPPSRPRCLSTVPIRSIRTGGPHHHRADPVEGVPLVPGEPPAHDVAGRTRHRHVIAAAKLPAHDDRHDHGHQQARRRATVLG
ncbi:hypothetical protein SCANM63S_10316 [Streptomyces canarius]